MSIVVTEKAAGEFQRIIKDKQMPESTVLRVRISAGGCSGFEYKLGLDEAADPVKDQVTTQHGVPVAVDKKSALYLDGTTLDFYDGIERRGFTFNNPNATRTCGCGSSFSA